MAVVPPKTNEELAKACGLDPSTPYETLLDHVNHMRQRMQSLEERGDWRHLLTQGVATDCTIKVRIASPSTPARAKGGHPPAKRRAKASCIGKQAGVEPAAHVIKAHSIILSSRSEYFKAVLMRGQWAESQDKTLEVELPSEEAVKTFELLVELSYGVTYTRRLFDDPSTSFDPNTLVQLIVVADMFEFVLCIQLCCEQLIAMDGEAWDVDMALSMIDSIASVAHTHDSVTRLLDKAVESVGMLEMLWSQGPWCDSTTDAVKSANIDKLKALTSVDAVVCLFKSDKLAMHNENTAFTLVDYWLQSREDWDDREKLSAFDTIMDSRPRRLERMDPAYLVLYALRTPWLAGRKKGTAALQSAVLLSLGAYRRGESASLLERQATEAGKEPYKLEATLSRQDCVNLNEGHRMSCFIGLVGGMPMFFEIQRRRVEDEEEGETLGMFAGWSTGGYPRTGDLKGTFHVKLRLTTSPVVKTSIEVAPTRGALKEDNGWGFHDLYGKPWEEIMAEGSPYFTRGGIMKVKVQATMKRLSPV